MRRNNWPWLPVILLLLGGPAPADQLPRSEALADAELPRSEALAEAELLRPEALVEAVLAANPGLQAMAAAVEAAEYRIAPAGALDDPRATFGTAPRTLDGSARTQWSFSQSLPWPGKRALRTEVARWDADTHRAEEQALRLELVAAARALYAEWVYVHEALEINAEHQAVVADLIDYASSLLAADLAGRQDLIQAETQASRLRTQAVRLEHARRETAARINALRGQPPGVEVPRPQPLPAASAAPPLEELASLAWKIHPELNALRTQQGQAESRQALAERDFLPDFTVSAGYNELWDMSERRWTVGVSINLPLDLGGKRRGEVNAARADQRRLGREIHQRALELESELEIERSRIEEALERSALLDLELVPLAEQNLEAALDVYASGEGRFLEVLDAQRQQLALEEDLARARADHFQAVARMERWTGTGSSP